jgi:hypothetical protein
VSLNGTAMAVNRCGIGKKEAMPQRNGIRGIRSHFDTDARKGVQRIGGPVDLEPSFAELVALMALAIGSGGNAADSLTAFNSVVNRVVRYDTYTGCKVSRATLSGQQGGVVSCSLDVVGQTEVTNTGTISIPASDIPFLLSDLALNLAGSLRETQSFQLVIDNHIDAERFMNSTTLSQVVELDRTVSLTTTHPWNDANADLYDQVLAGAAGSLALNNGTNTGTFSFGKLQVPAETPDIPGKSELMLVLNMMATKVNNSAVGTTDEIAFASS